MKGFSPGYARYRCRICDDGVWHEGGWARLAKHVETSHPGTPFVPREGDIKIMATAVGGHLYGGRKAMKRGGYLKRYTPLKARTEMVRKAFERKPKPAPKKRQPAVPRAVKKRLAERSHGWCEAALDGCSRHATDPHHRQVTGMGGRQGAAKVRHDDLSDLLHLCRPCHDQVTSPVGERRQYALDTGLIVLQHEDPFEVPVNTPAFAHLHCGPVHLSPCGGVWPADLSPIDQSEDVPSILRGGS